MTYGMLKSITTGLLTGDNVLPADATVLQGMVQYALNTVAMQAESFHLMTLTTTSPILRMASGDYLIRTPIAPDLDGDILDIDEELSFAVARYLASYFSREKGGIHVQAATRIILDYNAKTYAIIDKLEDDLDATIVAGTDYVVPDPLETDWYL